MKRKSGHVESATVSASGREAEKRDATRWLVRDAGGTVLTGELRAELSAEFHGTKKGKKPAR